MLVLLPYLLQVDLVLVVDFLREVEVVPVVLERVSVMPLVGLKKVVWN
jgi:hypothetical protein